MYSSDTIFWEGILKSFDNFTVFGIKLPQSCYSDGRYTGRQAEKVVISTSQHNSQKFLHSIFATKSSIFVWNQIWTIHCHYTYMRALLYGVRIIAWCAQLWPSYGRSVTKLDKTLLYQLWWAMVELTKGKYDIRSWTL